MGDCLRIGRDHVMLLVAQVDVARLETPEGLLDHAHLFGGTPMVYDDLWISLSIMYSQQPTGHLRSAA